METLIVLITTTVLSAVGWWLGAFANLFAAIMLSVVGTAAGVYFGRKIAREYLP